MKKTQFLTLSPLTKNLIACLLVASLISCASTTTIQAVDSDSSIDQDVKIYMDGSYRGKGEVLYSDTKIIGSTTQVNLKKSNCRTTTHILQRSEQVNVGVLIGGFFLWPLWLWVMGYNPLHSYEFNCDSL